jgi:RimJ/RimL family protein N-acetyltransferase
MKIQYHMTKTLINFRPEVLEDNVTKLIPLQENDFERLFAVASDPAIWEQHPTRDRYKREVFQVFFDGAISAGTAFLIFDNASNELIGSTRYYDYKADVPSVAIGYTFLAKKYWGGAYNRSVKKLMIDYAFQFVDSIFFHIGATNIRSQKAILKIGAQKVNEVDFDYYGKKLLHYEYEIRKHGI